MKSEILRLGFEKTQRGGKRSKGGVEQPKQKDNTKQQSPLSSESNATAKGGGSGGGRASYAAAADDDLEVMEVENNLIVHSPGRWRRQLQLATHSAKLQKHPWDDEKVSEELD